MNKALPDLEGERRFEEKLVYWRKKENPSGYENEGCRQTHEEQETDDNDSQSGEVPESNFDPDRNGAVGELDYCTSTDTRFKVHADNSIESNRVSDINRKLHFKKILNKWKDRERPSEYKGGKNVNEEFKTEKNDSQCEKGFAIDRNGAVDAETAVDVPQLSKAEEDEGPCKEGDLTVDVTGITGGKAGKVTAIGLEEISRNNKSTFEDSTFKDSSNGSRNSKKIKGEGMTGGEADEVDVVGRRIVSERKELTVKNSDVDVSGDAGTSGHVGTALPGLSGQILNSTVIVHGGQTSGSGGNLLGQINASGVVPGTDNQGQNVDITETTESVVGDNEVTRKRMASEGALSDQDDYKMENQNCSFSTILGKLRIAVIGGPGSGKSSTANTLLGREAFLHESVIKLTTEHNNSECKVIDTLGLGKAKYVGRKRRGTNS